MSPDNDRTPLIGTEMYLEGDRKWNNVGNLPTVGLYGLRGVSLNNRIFMTGNAYRQCMPLQFAMSRIFRHH